MLFSGILKLYFIINFFIIFFILYVEMFEIKVVYFLEYLYYSKEIFIIIIIYYICKVCFCGYGCFGLIFSCLLCLFFEFFCGKFFENGVEIVRM